MAASMTMGSALRFFCIFRARSRLNSCTFLNFKTTVHDHDMFTTKKCLTTPGLRSITSSVMRWDAVTDQTEPVEPSSRREEPTEAELFQAIEYLQSEEYFEKYGDKPVWANYKRNHKGRIPPLKTRKRCIRGNGEKKRICGNPCPICRDESLVIHFKNPKLLEQFISPHSWNIYSTYRTGVCQWQYKHLCATIEKARQHGLLEYSVPFTKYNYEDYYPSTDAGEKEAGSAV